LIYLSAQNVSKSFGGKTVLKDINFTLKEKQVMGLVGVNGSGKTTLLRILAGELSCDTGSLSLYKGLKVGYLKQNDIPDSNISIYEETAKVFDNVFLLEQKLRETELMLAKAVTEEEIRSLYHRYDRLINQFEMVNGYAARSLIQGVLVGLGFTEERQKDKASTLSGGEITRLNLAKVLLSKPDILLLDEPTNHLDLDALSWLENYMKDYSGAVMVVSHDRYFLDKVCTDMLEILFGESEQYQGNYTKYMQQRVERFEAKQRAYDRQQKEIERQKAIIERYRSYNREKSIRAAESREKKLEKIEVLDNPKDTKNIYFSFSSKERIGRDALKVRNLSKSFGERTLFSNVRMDLESEERAIIIGPNGSGKTTFIECILGEQKPDTGYAYFGTNAQVGYYDQKQQKLNQEKTILDEVWDAFPRLDQTKIRSALGLFLFTGDEVYQKIDTLSGGEKARVALTKILLQHDNFLVFDEPTNHLDADSREMLEEALENFDGTLLCVSHDRYFINRIATKIIYFADGKLHEYLGNYDDYLATLEQEKNLLEVTDGITKTELQKRRRRTREEKKEFNLLKDQVEFALEQVALLEEKVHKQEINLSDPRTHENADVSRELSITYHETKLALERAIRAWEKAELELEHFKNEYI